MVTVYADTSFLLSILLEEDNSELADIEIASLQHPLPITDLGLLETRNALNLAIVRGRITSDERDALWQHFEHQLATCKFYLVHVDMQLLHERARELSDRHTPVLAARSLDLLHVAAALLLDAGEFLSFDTRQRKVAEAEGLNVRPCAEELPPANS